MLVKELINYQEKLYWIYRKINQDQIKEDKVQDLKELWNCDVVVRHTNQVSNYMFFLREIPEAEVIIEDEVNVIELTP